MIGGQKQDIATAQSGKSFRQPPVEGLERCGITSNIPAMAEKRIEIDEVRKNQVAIAGIVHATECGVEQRHVSGGLARLRHAAVGENIADLADAYHPVAARGQPVEQCGLGWWHGEIAPVGCAFECLLGFADEGTRDHPADVQRVDQPADDAAKLVKAFESEMRFMRGDLEDRNPPTCSRSACRCGCALRRTAR